MPQHTQMLCPMGGASAKAFQIVNGKLYWDICSEESTFSPVAYLRILLTLVGYGARHITGRIRATKKFHCCSISAFLAQTLFNHTFSSGGWSVLDVLDRQAFSLAITGLHCIVDCITKKMSTATSALIKGCIMYQIWAWPIHHGPNTYGPEAHGPFLKPRP